MTLEEQLEELRETMQIFDADASREPMSLGSITRIFTKIEDL